MPTTNLTLFFISAILLALSPGPGMLYVFSKTLSGGRASGIAASLGTGTGGLVHVIAASCGASALLVKYPLLLGVLKWCGVIYLLYQALKIALDAGAGKPTDQRLKTCKADPFDCFRDGVVSEVCNPKTALFLLAFLPQFVDTTLTHPAVQFALLGTCVVILNTLPDLLISWYTPRIHAGWLFSSAAQRIKSIVSATLMTFVALLLAFTS